jgi:ABC-type glycerol-3-phosphate transport system permease component
VLVVCSLLVVIPYLWAVYKSLQPFTGSFSLAGLGRVVYGIKGTSGNVAPHAGLLDNYGIAFNFSFPPNFGLSPFSFKSAYVHSMSVAATVMVATVLTSTPVGFVLAAYRFRGREILFTLLILTFMVPFTVITIPLYITIANLGFSNSLGGLIVTGLWSPLGILLMRQFIAGIPTELFEAARLDGASEWRLLVQMVVPLSAPAMGVLAVYAFMHSWDDFIWPAVVLHDAGQWTLPLLGDFFSVNAFPPQFVMAVAVMTILPVLVIYVFVAQFFIRGISDIAMNV